MIRASVLAALIGVAGPVPASAQTGDPGFTVVEGSAIAILVENATTMANWYGETFGLRAVKRLQADDGTYDVQILAGGGLVVELIQLAAAAPRPPERSLGLFKAGVFVHDLDAAYAWIAERASTVDAAPFTDEALQVRSFVFRDPEGNRLQLFERCAAACAR